MNRKAILDNAMFLSVSLTLAGALSLTACVEEPYDELADVESSEDALDDEELSFRSCPSGSGYFSAGGKCYYVAISYAANWVGANNACTGMGAGWHLAYIQDATEKTDVEVALEAELDSMGVADNGFARQMWLGAMGESSSLVGPFGPYETHVYHWRDAVGTPTGTMENSQFFPGFGFFGNHADYLWSIDFHHMFWSGGSNPFSDACVATFYGAGLSDMSAQNFKCESGDKRALCELN
ncbi:MAG: hypothetical protein AAGF11_36190 [Myxococcota bacterium]